MFSWWSRRKSAEILEEVRRLSGGDLLALRPDVLSATLQRHGLGNRKPIRRHLFAAAIECDVRRMLTAFDAGSCATMPPARLAADWASSIGLDAATIASVAATASAPVELARAYLRRGPIDIRELAELEDVAVCYGAPRSCALRWIEAAVNAEIDHQAARMGPSDTCRLRFPRLFSRFPTAT